MGSRPPRKVHQIVPLPPLDPEEGTAFGQDVAQEIGFLIELFRLSSFKIMNHLISNK